ADGRSAAARAFVVGASEAGGGQHVDFWSLALNGGDQVQLDVAHAPNSYVSFELFAPGTTDTSFSQTPPAATVNTSGNASDRVVLKAPYTGNFVLAVCEFTSDCRNTFDNARVNPMHPYTFTTTPVGNPM